MPKNFVSKIIMFLVAIKKDYDPLGYKKAYDDLLSESELFSESPNENIPQINDIKRFKSLLSTITDKLNVDEKIKGNISEGLNYLTENDPDYKSCGVFPFLHEDNNPYSEIGTFDLLEPVSIKNFSQPAGKCEVRQSPEIEGVADNVFRYFACYLKEIKTGSFDITGKAVTSNNYCIAGASCSLSILISILADILDKEDKIQRVTASGEIKADFDDVNDAFAEVTGFGKFFFSKLEAAYCYGSKILVLPERMYTTIANKSENHALSFLFKQVNGRLYYGLEGKLEDNLEIIYVKNIPDILDKVFDIFSEEDFKQAIEKKLPTHLKEEFIHLAKKYFSEDELTEMNDFYVEVKLIEEIKKKLEHRNPKASSEKEKNNNPEDQDKDKDEKKSTPEFPIDIFKKKGSFSILGPPGSGKTSILKNLGLKLIESDNYIPIFIKLHKFNDYEILPSLEDESIQREIKGELPYLEAYLKYTGQNLENFLDIDKDKIVLLLDGLDESSASNINEWIRNLSCKYKIILTSRVHSTLADGIITHTQEFDTLRKELINKYFSNKNEIAKIEKYLDSNNKFSHNPLFITLICKEWNEEELKIIKTDTGLIKYYTEKIINRQNINTIYQRIPEAVKKPKLFMPELRKCLQTLAFLMHCLSTQTLNINILKKLAENKYRNNIKPKLEKYIINNSSQGFPIEDVLKSFDLCLLERYIYDNINYETIITSLLKELLHTGLLIEIKKNEYKFSHLTFQEYLAAEYMATMNLEDIKWFIKTKTLKTKEPKGWKYNYLKQEVKGKEVYTMMYLHDPHWEKVLIHLINIMNQSEAQKLIKSIIKGELNNNCIKLKIIDDYLKNDLLLVTKINCELLDEKIIQKLNKALKDNDYYIRVRAAEALMKIGNPSDDVLNTLIMALKDNDRYVREMVGEALVKLGNPSDDVINALIMALKDNDEYVRVMAAEALGKLGNPSDDVLNTLIMALKDNDRYVREMAAEALGKLGNKSDDFNTLIMALKDNDRYIRGRVAEALGKLGNPSDDVINALIMALKDNDEYVRVRAAEALGKLGNPSDDVLNTLIMALKDNDRYVREMAAEALGKLGNPSDDAINTLIMALKDNDRYIRVMAAKALGKLGNKSDDVINALIMALKDNDYYVRVRAAEALGKLGNPSDDVINALIMALKDNDRYVREMAAEALMKIGNKSDDVINTLIMALKDNDEYVRVRAAEALGMLGNKSDDVINALIMALKDNDSYIRVMVAEALGMLGNSYDNVINTLIMALKDNDYCVCVRAAEALMKIGNKSDNFINTLIMALKDNDRYIRVMVAEALVMLGNSSDDVINALIMALKDNDSYIRVMAAKALGKLGNSSDDVINALIMALKDNDYYIRMRAAEALMKIGGLENIFDILVNLSLFCDTLFIRDIWKRDLQNNKTFIIINPKRINIYLFFKPLKFLFHLISRLKVKRFSL